MALASETRVLKAEISARAAAVGEEVPQFAGGSGEESSTTAAARKSGEDYHRRHRRRQQHRSGEEYGSDIHSGDDEDDLGLEGVTIIMHLRDKDDLTIDTDLTQTQTQM